MERLVHAVCELSITRDFGTLQAVVRKAARELTGADGATFVLRDGNFCHYVDEDAIGPLWKGRKFPLEACISGWVMENRSPVAIPDIYSDPRIPADAYRPTFVRSLLMVPIRSAAPIGAIGNYWSTNRLATQQETLLLQALADSTSTAMENIQLYEKLNSHVAELERKNYELSRFAWVASHDLQEPLRMIALYAQLLEEDPVVTQSPSTRDLLSRVTNGAKRLQTLISDLLGYTGLERNPPNFRELGTQDAYDRSIHNLKGPIQAAGASVVATDLPVVIADGPMMTAVFQNLIGNAVKFRNPHLAPQVRVAAHRRENAWEFSVSDNGIGIDPKYHDRVFGFFERLHPQDQYQGSGIGLASCKRIVEIHGGRIWMESEIGQGTTVFFRLPDRDIPG